MRNSRYTAIGSNTDLAPLQKYVRNISLSSFWWSNTPAVRSTADDCRKPSSESLIVHVTARCVCVRVPLFVSYSTGVSECECECMCATNAALRRWCRIKWSHRDNWRVQLAIGQWHGAETQAHRISFPLEHGRPYLTRFVSSAFWLILFTSTSIRYGSLALSCECCQMDSDQMESLHRTAF